LCYTRHEVLLNITKAGAEQVKGCQNQNNLPDILKIYAGSGNIVHFQHQPFEEPGCGLAHDYGTENIKNRA
jgi:hypothetical protein